MRFPVQVSVSAFLLLFAAVYVVGDDPKTLNHLPDRIEDLDIPDVPFERNLAFSSWIHELDEGKIGDWLAQSTQVSWKVKPKTRTDFQALLIRRLAEINPERALDFALKRLEPNRSSLMGIVFFEWAQDDPDGATERVRNLPYFDKRDMLDSVFTAREELSQERRQEIKQELGLSSRRTLHRLGPHRAWGHSVFPSASHIEPLIGDSVENPKKVWYEVIGRAQPNSVHYDDLATVALEWIDASGIAALEEVKSSLTSYEAQKYVLKRTLTRLVSTSPRVAFDFATANQFPGCNQTIIPMLYWWVQTDPVAAINRVHALPSSGFRRKLERNVLEVWLQKDSHSGQFKGDPALILDKLHLIPKALRGDASAMAIQRMIVTTSPSESADAVLRLDKESQLAAAQSLIESWLYRDQESAIDWIKTTPEIEGLKNELLLTAAKLLVRRDANLAFEIALGLPMPEHGFGPEGKIVSNIASSELETAMDFLPQVREGKTKLNAYVSVAIELILEGLTQDTLDLGRQLTERGEMAAAYYLRVGEAWAQFDPRGLVESLKHFPTAEIRSLVAARQIRWNSSTSFFSEQQIQLLRQHVMSDHLDFLDAN